MYIGYFVYENDLGYFFIEFFVNFVITYLPYVNFTNVPPCENKLRSGQLYIHTIYLLSLELLKEKEKCLLKEYISSCCWSYRLVQRRQ